LRGAILSPPPPFPFFFLFLRKGEKEKNISKGFPSSPPSPLYHVLLTPKEEKIDRLSGSATRIPISFPFSFFLPPSEGVHEKIGIGLTPRALRNVKSWSAPLPPFSFPFPLRALERERTGSYCSNRVVVCSFPFSLRARQEIFLSSMSISFFFFFLPFQRRFSKDTPRTADKKASSSFFFLFFSERCVQFQRTRRVQNRQRLGEKLWYPARSASLHA